MVRLEPWEESPWGGPAEELADEQDVSEVERQVEGDALDRLDRRFGGAVLQAEQVIRRDGGEGLERGFSGEEEGIDGVGERGKQWQHVCYLVPGAEDGTDVLRKPWNV